MDDEDDAEAMRRSGLLTLSTSIGLYVEEESLESSADAPDTDTDEGHELTLEEAHHNLRKLHIMRDHSAPEEFFSLLHATLVAVPLQCTCVARLVQRLLCAGAWLVFLTTCLLRPSQLWRPTLL